MSLADLGQWYYLIYLLPFALSFFMILASGFGSSHRSGVRSGHSAGRSSGPSPGHVHGGPRGAGRFSHAPGRLHAGPRAGVPPPHHGPSATQVWHATASGARSHVHPARPAGKRNAVRELVSDPHGPNAVLAFFGVGRAPGILLAQGFGLAWGATGFYITRMFLDHGTPPIAAALPAMGIAALGGIAGVKVVGEIGSRLMPSEETFAMSHEDLLGTVGTVVYPVSATMGRIHVYDPVGTLHVESARLCKDQTETIPNGDPILLVDYDETLGCFLVERSPI